jgi:protein-S-isoprenylcysteine O-methyltransferase Ste14
VSDPGASRLPSLGPNGEGWVALQAILLIGLVVAGSPDLLASAWAAPWLLVGRVGGGLLIAGGLGFAALGILGLRENLTANPRPRQGGRLIDTGVYGIVRHPIYTGIIVAAFGWGCLASSVAALLVAALLGVFFDTKARREEAWLRVAYPDYDDYRRRVHKLVPLLY